MKWLDYHTHKKGCEKYLHETDVTVVQSLEYGEQPHPRADYITIGLHPMNPQLKKLLGQSADKVKQMLRDVIEKAPKRVIAIGECGWDKRSPLSEAEQNLLMDIQISVAEQMNLPLILHVVSYWHLVLKAQKEHPSIPWIIHGFRGNPRLAEQLQNAGIHLSLHPTLIEHSKDLPDSFFIETDDSDANLKDLYERIANQKSASVDFIKEKIINYFYNLHVS